MLNLPHPDALTDQIKTKAVNRGGMQAIEDKALNAYHRALSEGKGREEAESEYFKTFQKGLYGK